MIALWNICNFAIPCHFCRKPISPPHSWFRSRTWLGTILDDHLSVHIADICVFAFLGIVFCRVPLHNLRLAQAYLSNMQVSFRVSRFFWLFPGMPKAQLLVPHNNAIATCTSHTMIEVVLTFWYPVVASSAWFITLLTLLIACESIQLEKQRNTTHLYHRARWRKTAISRPK